MAQHISIRIPWKDNGYTGLVCDKPCFNTSCMKLKNIAENKKDSEEDNLAGQPIKGHEKEIPCLSEGGCFMSEDSYTEEKNHPYKKYFPKTHSHFLPTNLDYPPFSFPARPFAWTMQSKTNSLGGKISIEEWAEKKGIEYDPDIEPDISTNWIQEADNQRNIFEVFYQDVNADESLVIAYAKQVPFLEEAKRIVMGIGFVKSIKEPPEYNHTEEGDVRSILWETMVEHSIRDDRKNGFLMPYKEMMEYAEKNPDFDITSIAVLADDEYHDEFSYATEHVSHDAVITVLLKTIESLKIIKGCIPGNWKECIKWCKDRLKEVWIDRGPFPGLGSALYAAGFKHGELIAREIKSHTQDYSIFESEVDSLFESPRKNFSKKLWPDITTTKVETFKRLPEERKKLFWLLARVNLTEEQALAVFNNEERRKNYIQCTDQDLLENPYLLYERTRGCKQELQISVNKIDMAVFPSEVIADINPVPEPSYIESGDDQRRIRALSISVLETQANNGHTVYPQSLLIKELEKMPLNIECDVSEDTLNAIEEFLENELVLIQCEDDSKAYQLKRLNLIDNYIRKTVEERQKAERIEINEDWVNIVNSHFNRLQTTIDEKEKKAREEKAAILKELAESNFSVLIGGAGTGKTTLLSLLCQSDKIKNGGVLLLAPTGKARVRISKTMNEMGVSHTAFTIAQFLIRHGRFNYATMNYMLSREDVGDIPATVIIDECSMMTEEMFGALLSALQRAQRIIFVGDPNQLPPIGAGRPFVDLVRHLKHDLPPFPEPQVTKGFGELTITRRQSDSGDGDREDSRLAEWFKEHSEPLDDDIFADLQGNKLGKHIAFKSWTTPEDLQQKILETICEETGMRDVDDVKQFDISLGGVVNGEWMNFGSFPSKLDSWQILSAYKNDASVGSAVINQLIHDKYRSNEIYEVNSIRRKNTPRPLGTDAIVYGDKVINTQNQPRNKYKMEDAWLYYERLDKSERTPIPSEPTFYVANGEIGVVEGFFPKPSRHLIRFNSQPLYNYSWKSKVADEGDCDLELAYALTVHKAQGSEFNKVILVLNEPSRMLSREMIYTALTRQKEKIIILYNEDAYKLKKYSSVEYSDIARRFTCLFSAPKIVDFNHRFYEDKLIHKTKKGDMVRSKSEVIVADALFDAGIEYGYEDDLPLKNGIIAHPDFTIYKASKPVYYWEHLGMLQKEEYRQKWDIKRKSYEEIGIIEGKNLIISKDGLDGSIDSQEIDRLIKEISA